MNVEVQASFGDIRDGDLSRGLLDNEVFQSKYGFELDGFMDLFNGVKVRVFLPFHVDINIAAALNSGGSR